MGSQQGRISGNTDETVKCTASYPTASVKSAMNDVALEQGFI